MDRFWYHVKTWIDREREIYIYIYMDRIDIIELLNRQALKKIIMSIGKRQGFDLPGCSDLIM